MKPQFLIAAPHSGAGKTTVTLGILRALSNQGLTVQPFKCGPDYLDPKLHAIASGKPSINVDRFMMNDAHITELYANYGSKADVLVTEGVMGLYDGSVKMEGSSADIARLLDIPVIMVINAKAMAYSAAALLLGFKMLCPDLKIAGVIFNFVDHESHYKLLKEAAEDVGITPLGFLPSNPDIQIPSRHLGLNTGNEINHHRIIEKAAAHIAKYIDLDELMQITLRPITKIQPHERSIAEKHAKQLSPIFPKITKKILIANDAAFNFTYTANISALSSLGEISYFSPLTDTLLPDADLIYLPGGYPELHLESLSANKDMLDQLYTFHQNGGKILAECGGMMYLGKYIADDDGTKYPMAGILDIATGMQHKKLSIGYKRINIAGAELKGHEFHYSQYIGERPMSADEQVNDVSIWNARNEPLQLPVFVSKNILASYFHFYFGNNIKAIDNILNG
jgi:cobyrinic acid a,c-diamide synthase